MGALRPLDGILSVSNVPASISKHRTSFLALDLKEVRHVAADFQSTTVNLYFRAKGPVSEYTARNLVTPVFLPFPPSEDLAEMANFMSKE